MNINRKKVKTNNKSRYNDGRSDQIEFLIKNFLKNSNYNNLDLCLNSEKLISEIK